MLSSHTNQTAITIGTFDGVHRGHQALVQGARGAVGPEGKVVVVTFDPNPASLVGKPEGDEALQLTSPARRETLLLEFGADVVQTIIVDQAFLQQSPQDFLQSYVLPHAPSVLVEGPDFRFGSRRAGDLELLREVGKTHGWLVAVIEEQVAPLADGISVPIRSSRIRWLLLAGRVREAGTLLGRAFSLEGDVRQGAQRGRELGVPTANLHTDGFLVPMDGVYAGVGVLPDGRRVPAAISVGTNPTFGDKQRSVEAHLLDFDGEVGQYGWPLGLEFHRWLRDQVTCDDLDALRALIARDITAVRAACEQADYAFAP